MSIFVALSLWISWFFVILFRVLISILLIDTFFILFPIFIFVEVSFFLTLLVLFIVLSHVLPVSGFFKIILNVIFYKSIVFLALDNKLTELWAAFLVVNKLLLEKLNIFRKRQVWGLLFVLVQTSFQIFCYSPFQVYVYKLIFEFEFIKNVDERVNDLHTAVTVG